MSFKAWLNESEWSVFGQGGDSDEDLQKYMDAANLWNRGMHFDQIAARYGVSRVTVRKWISRSMAFNKESYPNSDDKFGNWPDAKATTMSQIDLTPNQLERGRRKLRNV
jgi:uncharacterized protein YjcR